MLTESTEVLDARRAGVVLHITSLPTDDEFSKLSFSGSSLGDFGGAFRFIDFLVSAGMSVWQVLPMGPTHKDLSPYLCTSSLAGNPLLINLNWLRDKGWLSASLAAVQYESVSAYRISYLKESFEAFSATSEPAMYSDYQRFIADHNYWLSDFALFTALTRATQNVPWMQWDKQLRDRQFSALDDCYQNMAAAIEQVKFEQFVFYTQWHEIKHYANCRGVLLLGDMPLFVAHDSAEVWASRQYFRVDDQGGAAMVAGVPPDYFSATGQIWGNPVYDWQQLEADRFQWWVNRIRSQLELFDRVRVDHFRGLEACWEIPRGSESAVCGEWRKTPGLELLQTLEDNLGCLPLIAEDLGFITEEVHQLREHFNLPGMKVMQFAFDGSPDNPYLLKNHITNCVAYTGTHDNDTSLGWYQSLPENIRSAVDNEIKATELSMPLSLIDYTLASVARWVIIPMQDLLSLGSDDRLNTPGTIGGNWGWQFSWRQVSDDLPSRLHHLVEKHHRTSSK